MAPRGPWFLGNAHPLESMEAQNANPIVWVILPFVRPLPRQSPLYVRFFLKCRVLPQAAYVLLGRQKVSR